MYAKFTLRLLLAFTLFIPLATHAQRKPRIIVVTHGQAVDPFWLIVKNGVQIATKETDSDVDYRSPEKFDLHAMARLIDDAVASEPDGLVVTIRTRPHCQNPYGPRLLQRFPWSRLTPGWKYPGSWDASCTSVNPRKRQVAKQGRG